MGLVRTPDGRLWNTRSGGSRGSSRGFRIGDDDDDDDEDEDMIDVMLFGANADLYAGKGGSKRRAKAQAKLDALKGQALARAAGGFSRPTKGDGYGMRLPLPFERTIAPGATVEFNVQPQNDFQLCELVISSPNAQLFNMNSLKVGTDDQYVASGPLNLDILSSQSMRSVDFKGSWASPGVLIFLNITNLDGANAQTLRGSFLGPTVRYNRGVAG